MNGWPRSLGSMDRVESSVLDHLVSLTLETGWATRFEKNAKNLTYLLYRSNWSKVLISLQSDGWQQRPALTTRQTRRQQARHIDNFVNYNRLGTKSTISWWGLMHVCTFSITSSMLNLYILVCCTLLYDCTMYAFDSYTCSRHVHIDNKKLPNCWLVYNMCSWQWDKLRQLHMLYIV